MSSFRNQSGFSLVMAMLSLGVSALITAAGMSLKQQGIRYDISERNVQIENRAMDDLFKNFLVNCDDFVDHESVSGVMSNAHMEQLLNTSPDAKAAIQLNSVKFTTFRPRNETPAAFAQVRAQFNYQSRAEVGAKSKSKDITFTARVVKKVNSNSFVFATCAEGGTPYTTALVWKTPCATKQENFVIQNDGSLEYPPTAVTDELKQQYLDLAIQKIDARTTNCTAMDVSATILRKLCSNANAMVPPDQITPMIMNTCAYICQGPINSTRPECLMSGDELMLPGGVAGIQAARQYLLLHPLYPNQNNSHTNELGG